MSIDTQPPWRRDGAPASAGRPRPENLRGVLALGVVLLVLTAAWVAYSKSSVSRKPSGPVTGSTHSSPPPQATTLSPTQRQSALEAEHALSFQKEMAWRRYFQPSAQCERPSTWSEQIACGNLYASARQAFEWQWKADHAAGSLGAAP